MSMKKRILLALLAVAPAFADVVVDGGWYGFCYQGSNTPITADCQNAGVGVTGNPVTFTLTTPGVFRITDAFFAGDTFDVYSNGHLILQTSVVAAQPAPGITDPDLAFANPAYSRGSVALGPGSYQLQVFVRDSPFDSGAGYLSVISSAAAVPEPAAVSGLMAAAALAIGIGRRQRQRQ